MAENQPNDPLIGRLVDSRYQIDAFIARGGMATVYRATDIRLGRTVALKIMHPSLAEDPDFIRRFEREARAAATFSHSSAVAVYDQGSDLELVYLAMEYVDGSTLRELLLAHGSLSAPVALSILEPVLDALSAAHRAGFVHRDVKPENILISQTGQVKIADFGLARAIDESTASKATQGILIGTVAYLAPEQVKTGHADERSDVYSAGIILYESVVGQTPFTGATPLSVAYQHVNDEVAPPSNINPQIPAAIDELVKVATAKDPKLRYADAADFSHHVHAIRSTLDPEDSHTFETIVIPLDPRRAAAAETPMTGTIAAGQSDTLSHSTAQPISESPAADLLAPDSAYNYPSQAAAAPVIKPRRFRTVIALLGILALVAALIFGGWRWTATQYVAVPTLTGMTQTQAKSALAQQKLSLAIAGQEFSDSVPQGNIISSDPAAGENIANNGTVRVTISAGPENVKVPKIGGLEQSAAQTKIKKANLTAQIVESFSDTVPAGSAIEVRPKSGSVVKSGSTVELVISKGPPPVVVPNVVTMSKDDAIARLTSLGLKVQVNQQLPLVVIGRVYSQDPGGGTTVPKGSTVTLTLV